MKSRSARIIFLMSFFILLSAGFAFYYYKTYKESPKGNGQLPLLGRHGHRVSNFAFYNQDSVLINQDSVAGKVRVVEFFFSTCKGICPKMNENMSKVYDAYRGNRNVVIMSHTVDPLNDSVATLKAYSQRFDANANQWYFLTGDKQALYDMARYSYLLSAEDDTTGVSIDKDFIHDNHFVLVDGFGNIRGSYDGLMEGEVKQLIGDVQLLLNEMSVLKKQRQ